MEGNITSSSTIVEGGAGVRKETHSLLKQARRTAHDKGHRRKRAFIIDNQWSL